MEKVMYSTRYYKMANKLNQGSTDQYIAQGMNALAGLFKQPNPQELLARQQIEAGKQKAGMLNTIVEHAKTLPVNDQVDLLSAIYAGKSYADTDLAQSTRKLMDVLNPNQVRYVPENLQNRFGGKPALGGNLELQPNENMTVSPELQKAFGLPSPNLYGTFIAKQNEIIQRPDSSILAGVTKVNRGQNAIMPDGSIVQGQAFPEKPLPKTQQQKEEIVDSAITPQKEEIVDSAITPQNLVTQKNLPTEVPSLSDNKSAIESSIKNPELYMSLPSQKQKALSDFALMFKKAKDLENLIAQNPNIESPLKIANYTASKLVGAAQGREEPAWTSTQSEYYQLLKSLGDLQAFINGAEAAKTLKPMSNSDFTTVKNAYNQISPEKPPEENLKHVQTLLRMLSDQTTDFSKIYNTSYTPPQPKTNQKGLSNYNFGGITYELRDGKYFPVGGQ